MKVTVTFSEAADISVWAATLADDGWKITALRPERIDAECVFGNISTYPPRQSIHWYLTVEEIDDETRVSVEVPVFAESDYARQRLLETVEDCADATGKPYRTDENFDIDLLGKLDETLAE